MSRWNQVAGHLPSVTMPLAGRLRSYAPNNGAAAAGDLTTFNGKTAAGTWKLCVGDFHLANFGRIRNVTLTILN
jgi:subtilisin-like proprotein convertase family protein